MMLAVATNLTISIVMTLSGAFSEGVDLMSKKDFKKAAQAFTKVITAEEGNGYLQGESLLLRAQCHREAKDNARVLKDIESLFASDGSRPLWGAAVRLYTTAGGKEAMLLPKQNPAKTWELFMVALRGRDIAEAGKYVTREFAGVVKGTIQSDDMQEIAEWLSSERLSGAANISAIAGYAEMVRKGDHRGEPGLKVVFARGGNEWKISGMYPSFDVKGNVGEVVSVDQHGREFDKDNGARIEEILAALSDFAEKEGNVPGKLTELVKKGLLEGDKSLQWRHPLSGKLHPFIYMMEVVPKPEALARTYLLSEGLLDEAPVNEKTPEILIVAPLAVNGKRDVGTSDGWKAMDDGEFAKLAVTRNWKIKGVSDALKSDEDTAKEVQGLIEEMRSQESAKRKAARDRLIEIGVPALTELMKYEGDNDPEIRESVKTIIGKLK